MLLIEHELAVDRALRATQGATPRAAASGRRPPTGRADAAQPRPSDDRPGHPRRDERQDRVGQRSRASSRPVDERHRGPSRPPRPVGQGERPASSVAASEATWTWVAA